MIFDVKDANILIIDDNLANLELLTEILKTHDFRNIKTVDNPNRALDLFLEFNPDIVLLDLLMPEISGIQVLQIINAQLAEKEYLPIIVITAETNYQSRIEALSMGARDFITKPFDVLEIILRIQNLLETRYFYKHLINRNKQLEQKLIEFLKVADEWYK